MSYRRNWFLYESSLLFRKTDNACYIRNVPNDHIQSLVQVVAVDVRRLYQCRYSRHCGVLVVPLRIVVACDDCLGYLFGYFRCGCRNCGDHAQYLLFHLDLEQQRPHQLLQLLVLYEPKKLDKEIYVSLVSADLLF